MTKLTVNPPMFISSRLMAAIRIDEGTETGGTVHLLHEGTDRDGRQSYSWVVEAADGTELETGADLRSGVGDEPDYTSMMATLLSFLDAAAEAYRAGMDGRTSDNADMFSPAVMEWAYMNSDELGVLSFELRGE